MLHPVGEAVFTLLTYDGNIRLCATDDTLTPFGGLVTWAAFQKQCGLLDWSSPQRMVVGRRGLGEVSKDMAGTFWDKPRHEFEAYVTSLPGISSEPGYPFDRTQKFQF